MKKIDDSQTIYIDDAGIKDKDIISHILHEQHNRLAMCIKVEKVVIKTELATKTLIESLHCLIRKNFDWGNSSGLIGTLFGMKVYIPSSNNEVMQ